jgi:hypothetical protein
MKSISTLLLAASILASIQAVAEKNPPTVKLTINYETIEHLKNRSNNNISAGSRGTHKLKYKRASRRVCVFGSSNFKNKIVGGARIHFSKIDPTGSLSTNTHPIIISENINSCNNIKQEKSISSLKIQAAVKDCKKIVANNNKTNSDDSV